MAQAETLKSVIDCQICYNKMENARNLKCGHTFCFNCLKNIETNATLTCPVCRKRFAIINDNLDSISCKAYTCQFIIDTVCENIEQKQLKPSLCNNQNCAKDYTKKCTTCMTYFCDECAKEHINTGVKKCNIVSCDEYADVSDKCDVHIDKQIAFYCEDCKEMICGVCFLAEHKQHSISNIDDYKHKITVDFLNTVNQHKKLVIEIKDNNDQQLKSIKNEKYKIRVFESQINERHLFLQSLIDKIKNEQYSKLSYLRNSFSEEDEKLKKTKNKLDELLNIFSEVTNCKDFSFAQINRKQSKINKKLNILKNFEFENKNFTIKTNIVDYETIQSNLLTYFGDYTLITTDLTTFWKEKFTTYLTFQPIGVAKKGIFLYIINSQQKSVFLFDINTNKYREIELLDICQPLKVFCVENFIIIYDNNGALWKISKKERIQIWQNLNNKCSMTFDGNLLDINISKTLIQEINLATKKIVFKYKAKHGYPIEDVVKTEKFVYLIKLTINSDICKIIKYDASKNEIVNYICFTEDFKYLNISNNKTNNLYLYNYITFEISRLDYISFEITKIITLSETDVLDKISCATNESDTEVYIVNNRKQSVECYVDN